MECHNNHYEEQLYSVFKSFDVNNEEALDESAVHQLCDALQLEERGAALVDTLFEKKSGRVTFSQFRSGLLAVLGDRTDGAPLEVRADHRPTTAHVTEPSDDDSSGREVAPRFVFGSKKYGRRSRPQSGEPDEGPPPPRALSASRLDASPPRRPRPRRSASAMESRGDAAPTPEHDARVDRDEALALCRDLRMDAIDRKLVDRVFDEARAVDTSVGEFFERLNATLATSVDETRAAGFAPAEPLDDEEDAPLPVEAVIEAWEAGGVRRPRRLLAELGFTGASLRAEDLERALDEEGRAGSAPDGPFAAALALARLLAARASARAGRLAAERSRLRAAVVEADRRARLLAQEVDESHARLEAELRATLLRADARHADEVRRVAREAAAEAERAAAERARLDAELARREELEARLRADLAAATARADRAEANVGAAEEARLAVARDRDRLAEAARAADRRAELAAAEAAAAAALEARLEETARENERLRDRVEELAAELTAPRTSPGSPPPAGSLSVELRAARRSSGDADPPDRATGAATDTGVDGDIEPDDEEDEEKRKLIELVKELEASLEAMRGEYEACEEYWSGKVSAERAAHEAESAAADARLAELAARVAEFERRLRPARAPALAPIAEQAALEAQVAALEAELAAARRGPARRAACARCGRTAARAEAALRRLSARLAAADLLVKELYVENCELARRRAVP